MQTILLIENTGDVLSNLTVFLEMEGYKILSANNGGKGVELAEEFMPDLIVCDILIPETGGYEVFRALKGSPRTSIIPFVLSISKSENPNKAHKLGVDEFLVKPFDPETLLGIVRSQIRKARNLTLHI